jgi:hypothetical protein
MRSSDVPCLFRHWHALGRWYGEFATRNIGRGVRLGREAGRYDDAQDSVPFSEHEHELKLRGLGGELACSRQGRFGFIPDFARSPPLDW